MTKKIDHKAIAKKIEDIPSICEDGKKAVSSLLQEFGYKPPIKRIPKPGEVWADGEDPYYVVAHKKRKGHIVCIPLITTERLTTGLELTVLKPEYCIYDTFLASSLEQYITNDNLDE